MGAFFASTGATAWAIGSLQRVRRRQVEALAERARLVEIERDQRARLAVLAERARIAREMHDVVAHSLAVVIAQADGGRYAGTLEAGTAALTAIGDHARRALSETRRILGVLRDGDATPGRSGDSGTPQHGVDDLPGLVERIRAGGLAVDLTMDLPPGGMEPGLSLAAYRIVQEGLTNVMKHAGAGARAEVAVRCGPRLLEIDVLDDGHGPPATAPSVLSGSGYGVVGMRERVSAYGGDRDAGAQARWRGGAAGPDSGAAVTGSGTGTAPGSARSLARVLLVEDQALVRTGFRMVIDSQPDLTVVGEAGDGVNGVHQVRATRPDLVVMDVRMPVLGGVEATRRILALPAPPKVIVLTTFDLDEYALAAIRAGASGFLLKDAPPEEMLAALRAVHSSDAVLAPSTTRRLLDQLAPGFDPDAVRLIATLTAREREVLTAMTRGWRNAEIAERLSVGEGTVKTHVSQILAKLGARDRVQAVILAYEAGVVRPGGQ